MEPNQGMRDGNQINDAGTDVSPGAGVPPITNRPVGFRPVGVAGRPSAQRPLGMTSRPTAASEPNMMAQGPAGGEKPKKNTGMLVGMAVLLALAVGGIGFGIWAFIDNNSQKSNYEQQVKSLRTQVDSLTQQNAELQESLDMFLNGNVSAYSDDIVVDHWRVKIELPEEVSVVWYAYDDENIFEDCTGVNVSAVRATDYDGLETNETPLSGTVVRCTDGKILPNGTPIFSEDGYSYFYQAPSTVSDSDPQWVKDGVEAIKTVLMNKENYSKF